MRKAVDEMVMRACDICFSLLLLLGAALPACAVMIVSWLVLGSPFFRASRVGRGAKAFTHIKIRSMRSGLEIGRSYLEANRIPYFFRLVRASRLDEYPDLVRVLCGQLSLVGARPLPAHIMAGSLTPPSPDRHRRRLGLAGLAQLALVRRGAITSAQQFALDAAWVRRASPALYLGVLAASLQLGRARGGHRRSAGNPVYRAGLLRS